MEISCSSIVFPVGRIDQGEIFAVFDSRRRRQQHRSPDFNEMDSKQATVKESKAGAGRHRSVS